MKITMILTNAFDPDVRVYKEAKYLIEQGKKVTILCWDRKKDSQLPKREYKDGIEVIRFRIPSVAGTGYKQIGAYLKYVRACKCYLKKYKTDYVHCHDLDGMLAYRLMGKKKYPYVFDMHEYYIRGNARKKNIIKKLVGSCIKGSHYSFYENDGYLRLYDKKTTNKLLPLKNYPDTYLEKLPKTPADKLRIGYHGCVRSQIAEFSALFEACKDMVEQVRIDINGGGIDLEQLKELEKKYSNVYVHGAYDGIKDSTGLYQNTDLLFCGYDPNNANYQGDAEVVKFYEAIVTGTPLIITAGTGMAEKVKKHGLGVAVDTRDAKQLKDVIRKILEDKDKLNVYRDNMGKIAEDYQWKNAVKVLSKVY